ncbi:UNVERIFIED_CONTAM: hypothetical protein FKN15_042584 [Acipenser sinensis]
MQSNRPESRLSKTKTEVQWALIKIQSREGAFRFQGGAGRYVLSSQVPGSTIEVSTTRFGCFIWFSPQRALLSVVWILPTVNQDHGGYQHGYHSPCTFKCSKIIMKTEGKRKRLSPQPGSPALCFTLASSASVTVYFPQHGHPNA